jgi:hypothetical protein
MIPVQILTSMYRTTPHADYPPLGKSLLQHWATEELLGWVLDSAVLISAGELSCDSDFESA